MTQESKRWSLLTSVDMIEVIPQMDVEGCNKTTWQSFTILAYVVVRIASQSTWHISFLSLYPFIPLSCSDCLPNKLNIVFPHLAAMKVERGVPAAVQLTAPWLGPSGLRLRNKHFVCLLQPLLTRSFDWYCEIANSCVVLLPYMALLHYETKPGPPVPLQP